MHRPHLSLGRRSTDPHPRQPAHWRLGLYVRKNPILIGFTLSVVVTGILLAVVVSAVADLRKTQREQQSQAVRIAIVAVGNRQLVSDTASNRVQALRLLCTQNEVMLLILHKNADAVGSTDAIRALKSINCQSVLAEAIQQAIAVGVSPFPSPIHGNP